MATPLEMLAPFVYALFVIMTWSLMLYKDNPLFRIAESLTIGISLAYLTLFSGKQVIDANITPLLEGRLISIIPLIFGILIFARFGPKKYSWIIMMGGADPNNILWKIFSILKPQEKNSAIAVVIGSDCKYEKQLGSFSNVDLFKSIKSSEVHQLMTISQLGIFPASTIAIEACAVRLPFICGYYIDNQKEIYNGIKINNLAVCIDDLLQMDENKFGAAFDKITCTKTIEEIEKNQRVVLDRKSNKRIIEIFKGL